jgi:hypothetical protein
MAYPAVTALASDGAKCRKGTCVATDVVGAVPSQGGFAESTPASNQALPTPAQRALTFGLLLSGLRCTVQYLVLPFILPWIGVTGAVPPWITLVLGALALGALARNVRSLWRLHHPRKWSYLQIAFIVTAVLLLFTVVDIRSLLHV